MSRQKQTNNKQQTTNNKPKLFFQTQLRLTLWYAGVMGLILILCGGISYQVFTRTYYRKVDRELRSLAGTVHDSLEPLLEEKGEFTPTAQQMFAAFCLIQTECNTTVDPKRHIKGVFHHHFYYVRFFDESGQLVAVAGNVPKGLPQTPQQQTWKTIQCGAGQSYRQVSFHLHTTDQQQWGYFQVGRSLSDVENVLSKLRVAMMIGLPLLIGLVMLSGWCLARSALRPIDEFCQHTQEFTTNVAHELRTPVTAIRATLDSLQKMPILQDPEIAIAMEATTRQIQRLTQLVNDLLMLCRMEQQEIGVRQPLKVAFEPVSLKDLIEDTAEEFAGLAFSQKIALKTQLPATDIHVFGHPEHLYRLLGNLVGNALQYTEAGGEVLLSLEKQNQEVWIQVKDTGIGISEEEQSRIFERFYRGNGNKSPHKNVTISPSKGTGLGLAIASAIAKEHNAILSVKSQVGQGSIFTLCFPHHSA